LQGVFLLIKRIEPALARIDIGLDVAHVRCGIDQLRIEIAAILAEHLNFAAQLGLRFGGIARPRQRRVQFLVALFERVGRVWPLVSSGLRGGLRRGRRT